VQVVASRDRAHPRHVGHYRDHVGRHQRSGSLGHELAGGGGVDRHPRSRRRTTKMGRELIALLDLDQKDGETEFVGTRD
jgi:hypothetical protein